MFNGMDKMDIELTEQQEKERDLEFRLHRFENVLGKFIAWSANNLGEIAVKELLDELHDNI